MQSPRYFVFDVESVADGELVSKIRYAGQGLSAAEAVAQYRQELLEKYDTDFIPYTYQIPISVAIAKLSADYHLMDLVVLDEPQFRPHVITEYFWRGWDRYGRPTLVSFNGRTFDLPLLELSAFRYGISVPAWFNLESSAYEQHRNRYNTRSHIDVQELLTNFGSARFSGGLNLAASVLGKPGKMDVQGYMVQDMYDQGRLLEINNYCRCDVLDTYFVFLRSRVLIGKITLEQEQEIIAKAKEYLEASAEAVPAYREYLNRWGDWKNPWEAASGI